MVQPKEKKEKKKDSLQSIYYPGFVNQRRGNSLAVQWLGLNAFTAGAQVQSLVGELRSCKSCSVGKKERKFLKIKYNRASLVAQWLRVCLPMQGTRVRALVWEDPTCRERLGP